MSAKIRISYRLQLFLPMVLLIWTLIIGMAVWQYYNEKEYRKDNIKEQLNLVSARIINAYKNDIDPLPFIRFTGRYFRENELYDHIRISVYRDDKLIYNLGEIIDLEEINSFKDDNQSEDDFEYLLNKAHDNDNCYYSVKYSKDHRLLVLTVLPIDSELYSLGLPASNIWIIVFIIALIVTGLLYYSTRYFSRNITILKSFAERAANDPNFIPAMDYPHDELGDISRQIVHIYNERLMMVLKLKREHRVALHAIEERARLKRQLTNNINHELKTPIGVIKGYLDTIIENPDMTEKSRMHFLIKAREHVNRLVNLITDISSITRLEEGSGLINTERINFHDVVYTVANDLEESKAIGDMEFFYNIPMECYVMGNNNLLTGMLINLAKNSANYSKGTKCGVELVEETHTHYKFVFYDNGVGVGEQHLPFLFERFYRIDTGRARKSGGTGLGLAIVQNTILAHKGEISVANRPEGGLQFTFTLPKARR